MAQEVPGIVDVQHGEGAVVLRPRSEQQVLAALRARQRRLPEIVEAHEALQVKLAELAARRRGEEDLARIDDALAYMEARCGTEAWPRSATSASHAAVTAAARSGLLADLLGRDLQHHPWVARRVALPARPPADSLHGHRQIADAIKTPSTRR